jgi:2-amino-4-hydroxy-6-hydroxymethyldihydropteridine pyrophosphokinase
MAIAYIGLGSNLGEREKHLENAIQHLASRRPVTILKKSSVIETDPVDYRDQPRFLNQVIIIETSLAPHDLLRELKQAEIDLGRTKSFPKGPRTIDLDILLYDDIMLKTDDLTIPHPEIKNREFILRHLIELDPELIDPATGKKYRELL